MLQTLRLQNFKGFLHQTIDFAPLTLLTGLNSSGKSTVLQALLLLRQSYLQGSLAQNELLLNDTLAQIGTARDAFHHHANEDRLSLCIEDTQHHNLLAQMDYQPSTYTANRLSIDKKEDPLIYKESLFTDSFHYLSAERIGPRLTTQIPTQAAPKDMGVRGEWTIYFLHRFGQEHIGGDALCHPSETSPKLKAQVEAWLGEISPGTSLYTSEQTDLDLMGMRFSFIQQGETPSGKGDYRPTNVGFGLSYTLPVLVAVLSAQPGSLLLIENPEAHLHPKGQYQLGHLFVLAASCGIQLIIETHSDHVLNGIRVAVRDELLPPEQVKCHFFQRNTSESSGIKVESPTIDDNGRLSHWPDGFFDEWDKSLEKLLLPKG